MNDKALSWCNAVTPEESWSSQGSIENDWFPFSECVYVVQPHAIQKKMDVHYNSMVVMELTNAVKRLLQASRDFSNSRQY